MSKLFNVSTSHGIALVKIKTEIWVGDYKFILHKSYGYEKPARTWAVTEYNTGLRIVTGKTQKLAIQAGISIAQQRYEQLHDAVASRPKINGETV